MSEALSASLLGALEAALPEPGAILLGEAAKEKATSDWSRMGVPLALVRPSSTAEVSAVLRLCDDARQPVTTWGGKTGLVHGGFADGCVALSLERMNRVEEIDPVGGTVTAEAGCILQVAAEAAEAQGLLLPLDLGARGSATIGGVLSTNAGGNRVIRYGMVRDLVLGLEAVLADGTVVSSMKGFIKNNAGYDLKQLFIGSEGTLGVITRAVLRLRPLPASQDTAFIGVAEFSSLPRLLRRLERGLGGGLSAFEVMWAEFYDLVTSPPAKGRAPLAERYPYYVLAEAQGQNQAKDSERFEAVVMEAYEEGLVADAAIAKSEAERVAMWALRDDVSQTARNWPIFTYDVSLRIGEMEAYVAELRAALGAGWPSKATLTVFGHIGDGNLHLVVGVGARDPATKKAVNDLVYGGVIARGGSISAEHGIGLEKRDYLGKMRSPEEMAVMRRLKQCFDPHDILNPGKVLSVREERA
jgi:FAD/FMN-containing dehydrogenase